MATVKKIKKADSGDKLIKKKETSSGSMYKYKSDDGNYTTKIKYKAGEEPTPENPQFKGTYTKRRTLKGLLSGAPKPMKKGGVTKAKDGKWIQKATASIKKRGTEGVCTGKKFGGPTCKPGSKRYNLAKVFKGMAKKKK